MKFIHKTECKPSPSRVHPHAPVHEGTRKGKTRVGNVFNNSAFISEMWFELSTYSYSWTRHSHWNTNWHVFPIPPIFPDKRDYRSFNRNLFSKNEKNKKNIH